MARAAGRSWALTTARAGFTRFSMNCVAFASTTCRWTFLEKLTKCIIVRRPGDFVSSKRTKSFPKDLRVGQRPLVLVPTIYTKLKHFKKTRRRDVMTEFQQVLDFVRWGENRWWKALLFGVWGSLGLGVTPRKLPPHVWSFGLFPVTFDILEATSSRQTSFVSYLSCNLAIYTYIYIHTPVFPTPFGCCVVVWWLLELSQLARRCFSMIIYEKYTSQELLADRGPEGARADVAKGAGEPLSFWWFTLEKKLSCGTLKMLVSVLLLWIITTCNMFFFFFYIDLDV